MSAIGDFEVRLISHSEMRTALETCGLRHFTVRYEETYQSDLVEIRDAQVSDDQLVCAFEAQDRSGYILTWDQALTARYYEVSQRYWLPRAIARAQNYFEQRPELGSIPTRSRGQNDLDFAREIERFCGPAVIGMMAMEYGTLTISHDWISGRHYTDIGEAFGCMMNAATLTDLKFGLVGNEVVAEEQPETGD